MAAETIGKQNGGHSERGWDGVSVGRPARLHYVVARHGETGLEVLHMSPDERGETLPVFSAGWVARGYLFAEAPGGGWHVRACTPDELISLLAGPCAGVERVALDPRPDCLSRGEAPNMMPRENFVDYLSCSRVSFPPRRTDFEITGGSASRTRERSVAEGEKTSLGR